MLEATDIVRLVGEHVSLKKKGREHLGKCPFHDDHKPSMYVVPAKQIYHCFSCGAGGNAIDFLVNFHKMEFIEALKRLAEQANIELTPRSGAGRADAATASATSGGGGVSRADMLAACAFAQEFFRAILRHPEHGALARAMIDKRAISPEMVDEFGIGAAPDKWDGLLITAQTKGLRPAALAAAGLAKARENSSGSYDAFRNRLMFPIHDLLGRPIAFGGRKLRDEDDPKYINSSETPLFDKSKTLFGLKQAQRAIQDAGRAIIVEGYLDAIACHQAGVKNVVATLGTALTPEHARILQRVCDEVVLVFDGDEAGSRAADRAVEVFFAQPIDVRIATLASTGAKDPDELLKQDGGREKFDGAIAGALDALEFRFARLRSKLAGAGLSARARLVEEDVQRLAEMGLARVSPVRKTLVVRRLASLAGATEQSILEALSRARVRPTDDPRPVADHGAKIGASLAGHALGALLCEPALWASLSHEDRENLRAGAYAVAPSAGKLVEAAQEILDLGDAPTLTTLQAGLDEPETRRLAAMLAAEIETITGGAAERIASSLRDSMREITRSLHRAGHAAPPANDVLQRVERERAMRERYGRTLPAMPRPDAVIAPAAAPAPG